VSDMQAPTGPQDTPAYKAAKYAVIILSALIILALIGLVVGVAMKLSGRGPTLSGSGSGQTFMLPRGAKIVTTDVLPGRLVLHVRSTEGDEIDIVDTETGRLVSRIVATPPSPPVRQ
jgi:hypothetical protein